MIGKLYIIIDSLSNGTVAIEKMKDFKKKIGNGFLLLFIFRCLYTDILI